MSPSIETCVLCGGALDPLLEGLWDDRFGAPGRYDIVRCRGCATEQTVPRPSPEGLRALYERYYNFGGSAEKTVDRQSRYARLRDWFFDSALYGLWLAVDGDVAFHAVRPSHGKRGRRLLDIGCNEGRGLARFKDRGFEPEGLELNRVAAAVARARGFPVHGEAISDFRPDRPFDVAVLSNVLEHALDPRAMLRDVRRVLGPEGEAWISLPNGASFLRALFGRHWINWHVPYHIVHFTPASIARLLREEGFAVESIVSTTPALWVSQSLVMFFFAKPERPTYELRRPFLVGFGTLAARLLLFPILWAANRMGRGDGLCVRARRVG